MKKSEMWLIAQAHETAVAGYKARIRQLEETLNDLYHQYDLTEAGLELIEKTLRDKPEYPAPKIRPDSEGWWWRHYRGKNGDEWEIGEAKLTYWEDAGEPVQERVLAWSTGGCQTRCDYVNLRTDAGTRWIKATPPVLDPANVEPSYRDGEKNDESKMNSRRHLC